MVPVWPLSVENKCVIISWFSDGPCGMSCDSSRWRDVQSMRPASPRRPQKLSPTLGQSQATHSLKIRLRVQAQNKNIFQAHYNTYLKIFGVPLIRYR